MDKKICDKCGEPREIEEFHVNKQYKDGRRRRCKYCVSKTRKSRSKNAGKPKVEKIIVELGKDRLFTDLEKNCYIFLQNKGLSFKQIAKEHNRDEDFVREKINEHLTAKPKPLKSFLKYAQG